MDLDRIESETRRRIVEGYASQAELVEEVPELLTRYLPEADRAQVQAAVPSVVGRLWDEALLEQASWPAVTDCDRLDTAFSELEAAGIISRQDFCSTPSSGHYAAYELASESKEGRGYVFFHGQSTQLVAEDGVLVLNFGSVESTPEASRKIAEEVVSTLAQAGLQVTWDGVPDRCIEVSMNWQKRLPGGRSRLSLTPRAQQPSASPCGLQDRCEPYETVVAGILEGGP